jgi:hypothetical protein
MTTETESVIGTFLYSAAYKNYSLYHLIFTTKRLIIANAGWKKVGRGFDLANVLQIIILQMPPIGPNTATLQMQMWANIKKENKGSTCVNYNDPSSEEVLKLGNIAMASHKIVSKRYGSIKQIEITDYPLTQDCRIKLKYRILGSTTVLIPGHSLKEFKELASKAGLSSKLADKSTGINDYAI